MLDLIGLAAPDPHDPTTCGPSVWAGTSAGKLVLICPFAITRIGVMANGSEPLKPERAAPGSIRTADLLGLSALALRQQKVRTSLTLAGVVIGVFTLVVSLAVGRGVDRAIVSLFHEDDDCVRFRSSSFEPAAGDIPAAKRNPRAP